MKFVCRLSSLRIAALLCVICSLLSAPASAQSDQKDAVVATVNGEPIYASQLEKGIPPDAFEVTAEQLRRIILYRLVYQVEMRQFLKRKKIMVTEQAVQEELTRLERHPPLMGCPCHQFLTLNAYLETNGVSREELTGIVRNDLGLKKYIQSEWERRYPTSASRAHLREAAAAKLNKEYTQAWHIFFSAYQPAAQNIDPGTLNRRAQKRADAAWKRLQNGESFAKVANETSEDTTSGDNGGDLGVISRDRYGRGFEDALKTLKPGEVSKPIRSSYGYHIIKWASFGDKALSASVRLDFDEIVKDEVREELQKSSVDIADPKGERGKKV